LKRLKGELISCSSSDAVWVGTREIADLLPPF
jgi:hypothetical protein